MEFVAKITAWLASLWDAIISVPQKAGSALDHLQEFIDATVYSKNMKRMLNDQTAALNVADSILELSVGAILVGTIELYGIQMIVNATGLTGTVNTMFTSVLVILIVIADVYIFMGAAKSLKKR